MSNRASIQVECPTCHRRVKVEHVQDIDEYTKCYCPKCSEHFFLSGWELFRLKRKNRRLAEEDEKAREALRHGHQVLARKQAAPDRLQSNARDEQAPRQRVHQPSETSSKANKASSKQPTTDTDHVTSSHAQRPSSVHPSNLFPCPDCGHLVSSNAAACPSCGRVMAGPSPLAPQGQWANAAPQENAPGATASLVCGILGFFFAGLIFGFIAVGLASQANKAIAENPGRYTGQDAASAGKILGIIDIVLWIAILFFAAQL